MNETQVELQQQSKVFLSKLETETETTSRNPLVKPFFAPIKTALHLLKLLHARVALLEKGA